MRRRAILLTTTPRTEEMGELAYALDVDLVETIVQRRPQPDPQYFLGSGKMEDVRDTVRALGAKLVVVNGQLKAGQVFGLQAFLGDGVEVYDRTRLILEIFRDRARSPEARLQVELAQLQYEMPLVKEAISLQKRGERQAAMFGGGEYEVNTYHDQMKKRMARIRHDLDKMRAERAVRRKHRRRGGFHLVSLAGYTNAGKSSLLRAMSDDNARRGSVVENRYFSTLSTKTARATSDRREILLTDTVGFIEDLPPWMVEAFHSTLEEIALADVILLVLDASDAVDEMARRLRSSLRVLWEFDAQRGVRGPRSQAPHAVGSIDSAGGADAARAARSAPERAPDHPALVFQRRAGLAPIVVALNKTDRVPPEEVDAKRQVLEDEGLLAPGMGIAVSAKTRAGLDDLYEKLYGLIPDYDEYEVAIPNAPNGEALVGWLHDHADVLDLTRGNETHVHFEAKRSLRAELESRLALVGASPLREVVRSTGTGSEEGPEKEEGARLGSPGASVATDPDATDPSALPARGPASPASNEADADRS